LEISYIDKTNSQSFNNFFLGAKLKKYIFMSLFLFPFFATASETVLLKITPSAVICSTGSTGTQCNTVSGPFIDEEIPLDGKAGQDQQGMAIEEFEYNGLNFQYSFNVTKKASNSKYVIAVFYNIFDLKTGVSIFNDLMGYQILDDLKQIPYTTWLGERVTTSSNSFVRPSVSLKSTW